MDEIIVETGKGTVKIVYDIYSEEYYKMYVLLDGKAIDLFELYSKLSIAEVSRIADAIELFEEEFELFV